VATWNDWFVSAKSRKVALEKFLIIDQDQDLKRLYSSGLPCFDLIILNGNEYNSKKAKSFISKYPLVWTRVVDKKKNKRQSRLGMKSFGEFKEFIESLGFDLENSKVQLYEMEENEFGGNVISSQKETLIEIAFGLQDIVAKSTEPFFHGKINGAGRLEFTEKETPQKVFEASMRVLSYLKKSRGEFLEGYFEFTVSKKGKVFFLDYKTSFK